MKKKALSIFSLIVICFSTLYSQNINWPKCSYVETEENFKNLIQVTVKQDGDIMIGNKVTNDFVTDLYNQYKFQLNHKQLDFSLSKVEIQADSTILLHDIKHVIDQLAKFNMKSIFYVAQSEHYTRIENIWSIGLNHEVFSENIEFDVKSKLRNELNIPPMPPPPPPGFETGTPYDPKTDFTLEHFSKNNSEYKINEFFLNSNFVFQTNNTEIQEYLKGLKLDLEKGKTVIHLKYNAQTKYGTFINILSITKNLINEIRENYCQSNFITSYSELNYAEQKVINDKYPFLFIIEQNDL